ncbi:Type 1 glutamine amidotransferase-like domain-containing protein [Rathayibacter sp. YIM 133350]|uniref:Type 1 glutamine amidotransferase-like domain-containing protein n=1 Tax=Rathayibacter sp. YIM 133350 TaxID=3131992 RepID=UPI00307F7BE8
MSVHLVGGGWESSTEVYGSFVIEATARAAAAGRELARIAVVAVRPGDEAEHAGKLIEALGVAGEFDAHVSAIREGGDLPLTAFSDVDGIVIGGGLTPAYRVAVEPHAAEIRRQVADGVPYLGFSAGSVIAAERALVGGWRIGGVAVCPEDASEDLDELTIEQGIGLIDVSIDVHAAQWGTVSRLVAAAEAGLVEGGIAIDEDTVLVIGEGGLVVSGAGSAWSVVPGEAGVLVSTMGA